ncbi:MAG: DUF1573 domain-containing protein [Chitinophagales bacterium]|nr:DUF1573 domain-containing protein [Chitinophagales bacterium]
MVARAPIKGRVFNNCPIALASCSQADKKESAAKDETVDGSIVKNPNTLTGATEKLPEITFEITEHDFGKIIEGEKKEYDFRFTNTGDAPLVISDVKASCGCTVPEWPKGVTKPGESDVIKVMYNSTGHPGEFNKGIVVTSNSYPNQTIIKILGVVFK